MQLSLSLSFACLIASVVACSTDHSSSTGQGGSQSSGGSGTNAGNPGQGGANASGGAASNSGGSSSGGANAAGGASNGGSSTGGSSAGQTSSGQGGANSGGSNSAGAAGSSAGASNGGASKGGASNAGASNGGGSNGGASNGGSGGASNGGASNGGSNAGGCAKSADTLFCEDFESSPSGTVGKANGYAPVTNMGTLNVDATHARGKQALHVHTEGNGKAFIQLSPFAPPQNSFFGRMYVWVTAFPSAPNYAHFTLVEASGTPSNAGVVRPIGGQFISGKGDLWGPGTDGGPTGDWTNWKESAPAEAGKWLCMEWEMTATNNVINIWIDNTAKTDLSVNTTMHGNGGDFVFPTFNNIWFGWWLYQTGSTPSQFDLWIDDISLGTKRQGC